MVFIWLWWHRGDNPCLLEHTSGSYNYAFFRFNPFIWLYKPISFCLDNAPIWFFLEYNSSTILPISFSVFYYLSIVRADRYPSLLLLSSLSTIPPTNTEFVSTLENPKIFLTLLNNPSTLSCFWLDILCIEVIYSQLLSKRIENK